MCDIIPTRRLFKVIAARWVMLGLCVLAIAIPVALAQPAAHVTWATMAGSGHRHIAATALTPWAYLPIVYGSPINQQRQDAQTLYLEQYLSSEGVAPGWTGNHSTCTPGETTPAFRDAVLRRVNYFRKMAGVPDTVTFASEYCRKAQAAALMMSVNGQLSHAPPPSWLCYSSDGAQGAGSSNLYLGRFGWDAVTGYIQDPGSSNYFVGHRRWILYPQTQEMGTGDIPSVSGYWKANALWVFDSHMWEPRPLTRDGFVAWPPPGYVPYQVVFARWSFSYPQADFSAATVTMTSGGASVSPVQSPVVNGYGENTLVWIPLGLGDGAPWPKPSADTTYTVNVQNVIIGGQSRNFVYHVIVFDPTPTIEASPRLVGIPPV